MNQKSVEIFNDFKTIEIEDVPHDSSKKIEKTLKETIKQYKKRQKIRSAYDYDDQVINYNGLYIPNVHYHEANIKPKYNEKDVIEILDDENEDKEKNKIELRVVTQGILFKRDNDLKDTVKNNKESEEEEKEVEFLYERQVNNRNTVIQNEAILRSNNIRNNESRWTNKSFFDGLRRLHNHGRMALMLIQRGATSNQNSSRFVNQRAELSSDFRNQNRTSNRTLSNVNLHNRTNVTRLNPTDNNTISDAIMQRIAAEDEREIVKKYKFENLYNKRVFNEKIKSLNAPQNKDYYSDIKHDDNFCCELCSVILGVGISKNFVVNTEYYKNLQLHSKQYNSIAPWFCNKQLTAIDVELSKRIFISKCGHCFCGRCVKNISSISKRKIKNTKIYNFIILNGPKVCPANKCQKKFVAKSFIELYC